MGSEPSGDSERGRSNRGRVGSVRASVRKAVRAARTANRVTPYDEPVVALAEVVARQLDAASDADRAGEVVRLTKSLRDLLADLPLRPEPERTPVDDRGRGAGNAGDPGGGADPVDRELAQLVGAGPEVGDTAHA